MLLCFQPSAPQRLSGESHELTFSLLLCGAVQVPGAYRPGDLPEVFHRGRQGDGALRPCKLHARFQGLIYFLPHLFGPLRKKGHRVIDVADQGDPAVDNLHGLGGIIFRIEVEGGHSRLGDILHSVQGPPTDMKDQRHGEPLDKLGVKFAEVRVVTRGADQVPVA